MQKKSVWALVLSLTVGMLLSMALLLQAQAIGVDDTGAPNDPRVNDRANACYDDPRFLNQCDTPIEWHCGYTIIRYDYGLIDQNAVIAGGCGAYLPRELSSTSLDGTNIDATGEYAIRSLAICPGLSFSCAQLFSCEEARACLGAGNTSLDTNADNIPCNETGNFV
ncbi:MAG: hypothetical protein AAF126_14255, partial [Chloroflexota bacterium]